MVISDGAACWTLLCRTDSSILSSKPVSRFSVFVCIVLVTDAERIADMISSRFGLDKKATFWGWFFVTIGSLSFLGFLFAAIISKLLPISDNRVMVAVQNDRYYCFLVPLTLPVLVVAVYFHWLSMKLFKHA